MFRIGYVVRFLENRGSRRETGVRLKRYLDVQTTDLALNRALISLVVGMQELAGFTPFLDHVQLKGIALHHPVEECAPKRKMGHQFTENGVTHFGDRPERVERVAGPVKHHQGIVPASQHGVRRSQTVLPAREEPRQVCRKRGKAKVAGNRESPGKNDVAGILRKAAQWTEELLGGKIAELLEQGAQTEHGR